MFARKLFNRKMKTKFPDNKFPSTWWHFKCVCCILLQFHSLGVDIRLFCRTNYTANWSPSRISCWRLARTLTLIAIPCGRGVAIWRSPESSCVSQSVFRAVIPFGLDYDASLSECSTSSKKAWSRGHECRCSQLIVLGRHCCPPHCSMGCEWDNAIKIYFLIMQQLAAGQDWLHAGMHTLIDETFNFSSLLATQHVLSLGRLSLSFQFTIMIESVFEERKQIY